MPGADLNVGLRIGQIGVSFRTSTPLQKKEIISCFGPFVTKSRPSFWRIALSQDISHQKLKTPMVLRAEDGFRVLWSRFSGDVSARSRSGNLRITSSAVLGTFLRAFMSQVLAEKKGFLVHSAGMKSRTEACVFPGVSGSGKTTISRLGKADTILSDEIVLIQKDGDRWMAFGTPFNGELPISQAAGAELKCLYFLEKSTRWERRPLTKQEAARRLLRCVLNFSQDAAAHRGILDSAADLVSTIPAYVLSFSKKLPQKVSLEQFIFA